MGISSGLRRVVVLVSGGMDSVTVLYEVDARYDVVGVLSFEYGSKHNDREVPLAAYHAKRVGVRHWVIRLDFIGELFESDLLKRGGEVPFGHYEEESMKRTVVPFRNGIMLSIGAGLVESLGGDGLVIAAHAGDHAIYPDCREGFMKVMGEAIGLGTYGQVEVIRPFISMTKADIVRCGDRMGIDYAYTWSCYVGGEVHCGWCGTCVERREAFMLAGIPDPTIYQATGPLPVKPIVVR